MKHKINRKTRAKEIFDKVVKMFKLLYQMENMKNI